VPALSSSLFWRRTHVAALCHTRVAPSWRALEESLAAVVQIHHACWSEEEASRQTRPLPSQCVGPPPGHRTELSRHATVGSSRWAIAWPLLAQCGHLHGSSDFKDKGGREENGWIGEKGEDILGEKRLGFGERRQQVGRSLHERRYFPPPRSRSKISEPVQTTHFFVSVD
jgi:hypothetical protein